jgi:hypothetical protein
VWQRLLERWPRGTCDDVQCKRCYDWKPDTDHASVASRFRTCENLSVCIIVVDGSMAQDSAAAIVALERLQCREDSGDLLAVRCIF